MESKIKEVENIKSLIAKAEIASAKAQGQIESIEDEWEKDYGFRDVESAEKKLMELEEKQRKIEEKLNVLYKKIKESYDWEGLKNELR